MIYYLKFDSAEHAASILPEPRPGLDIEHVGVIVTETGRVITDAGGFEYAETAPIEGWHVNVRSTDELPELAAFSVIPRHPVRVWA